MKRSGFIKPTGFTTWLPSHDIPSIRRPRIIPRRTLGIEVGFCCLQNNPVIAFKYRHPQIHRLMVLIPVCESFTKCSPAVHRYPPACLTQWYPAGQIPIYHYFASSLGVFSGVRLWIRGVAKRHRLVRDSILMRKVVRAKSWLFSFRFPGAVVFVRDME